MRVDISGALLLFTVNINDSYSVFHQKYIQNVMLLEKMLHLVLMPLLNKKLAKATTICIFKVCLCLLNNSHTVSLNNMPSMSLLMTENIVSLHLYFENSTGKI